MLAVVVLGSLLAWGSYRLFRPGGALAPVPAPTARSSIPPEYLGSAFLQDLDLKLVRVPAGSFRMGSKDGSADERPVHEVHLDGYWLARTEVTNAQYAAFVRDTGHRVPECSNGGMAGWNSWSVRGPPRGYADHPVVGVSWSDAVAYCEWLSRKTGARFRLPTEAEWEKACRAGTRTAFSWGAAWDCDRAMGENDEGHSRDGDCVSYYKSRGLKGGRTSPVGSFPANPWGFHDLHGNVYEWCSDWYDCWYYGNSPSRDPTGPDTGSYRVRRGGSWYFSSGRCRSANRYRYVPSLRNATLGFRPAMEGP